MNKMLTDSYSSIEEKTLWEMFLSGDDKAYAHFYKKYVKELLSYGMHFTTDRELVKDCIQDVFVKIYSSYHIDTAEPVFTAEYTIEDQMIDDEQEEERKEKMSRILYSLTPRQKEVIYYRYVEGMELKDICVLMDMNYQSVQNLIQRAIKKVKTAFPAIVKHSRQVKSNNLRLPPA